MKIILTKEQKVHLEVQHKFERDSRISDRIKAVLLANEGWTHKQIAQALRIHETTVRGHLSDYLQEEKLKPNNGGSKSKLDEQQTDELIAHLEKNTYPSTKEIIAHVTLTYGVIYTQQGMHDWLSHHRFSYKKPKGIPQKFNAELQAEFIKKYNELKATLKPDELILFMDSVHPTQETKITYGWIRRGVEKLIATVASRKRINLTGAIDLNTMDIITREYETINGGSTVDFLKSIEAANPTATKIHIIADGGGAHTSHEVALFLLQPNAVNRDYFKNIYDIELPRNNALLTNKIKNKLGLVLKKEPFLFENKSIFDLHKLTAGQLLNSLKTPPPHPKIVLHILPPYSPNLNPIERLWKVTNELTRNNQVFKTFNEFKEKIRKFFSETWDEISDNFRTRINDNFQSLKPVSSI
jgi:transposase